MKRGKNLGSASAATKVERYPVTSACEVNASIDCAREMRGTRSNESAVAPAEAIAATVSVSEFG